MSAIFIAAMATGSFASTIPPEFESFFIEKPTLSRVYVAGDSLGVEVNSISNYEHFQLQSAPENMAELRQYLTSFSLKPAYVDEVISLLSSGVKTDVECQGVLQRCVLQAGKNQPRFVYDYDNASVKIFTALEDLTQASKHKAYHSSTRQNNALVNWLDINLYSDLHSQNNLAVNNDTLIGLPMGMLSFDTQFQSNPNSFETYTALYDVEFSGQRVQAGKHRYNLEFNSTDFLSNNAKLNGESVYWGTSGSLIKGKSTQYQSIEFIAPQQGLLQLYRDERLILSKTVPDGKNTISYSELPSGSYNIQLILKVGGNEIINEQREIVNLQEYALSVGENDFIVGAGKLKEKPVTDSEDKTSLNSRLGSFDEGQKSFKQEYVRAAMTHRYSESTLLALAITSNQQDYVYQLGGKAFLSNGFSMNYFNAFTSNANFYQQFRLSYNAFYLDTQLNHRKEINNDQYDLMAHLYGKQDYRSLGGGWSGSLLKGSAFARYYVQSYRLSDESSNVQRNLSLGWSRNLGKHHVSVSVDWKNGDLNEVSSYLSWTYHFSNKATLQSTTVVDDDGFRSNATSLGYASSGERWHSQSTLGGFIDANDNQYVELSNSFNGYNDYINANSYLYASSGSRENVSLSLSSSQIVSQSGLDFSRHKAKSFVKVSQPQAYEVNLALSKEGEFQHIETLDSQSKLLPVADFHSLSINADGSAGNTYIKAGKLQTFVQPATLSQLVIDATKLVSDIVVLTRKDGSPISWVRCETQLCSIEPLTQDGVFRVNYAQSDALQGYQLVTEFGYCILDVNTVNNTYKQGHCP